MSIECFCTDSIQCQAMGEGLVLGSYQFNNYKTDKSKLFELDSVTVLNSESEMIQKRIQDRIIYLRCS